MKESAAALSMNCTVQVAQFWGPQNARPERMRPDLPLSNFPPLCQREAKALTGHILRPSVCLSVRLTCEHFKPCWLFRPPPSPLNTLFLSPCPFVQCGRHRGGPHSQARQRISCARRIELFAVLGGRGGLPSAPPLPLPPLLQPPAGEREGGERERERGGWSARSWLTVLCRAPRCCCCAPAFFTTRWPASNPRRWFPNYLSSSHSFASRVHQSLNT